MSTIGRDIDVDHTITNLQKIDGQAPVEIDIVAVNGEDAVAVEVKTTLAATGRPECC